MRNFIKTLGLLSILVASNVWASDAYWIDVRSAGEYDKEHVAVAVNITHTEIVRKIAAVTEDKDAEIYLYCRSGNRAGKAKVSLEELGYTNVKNVGGLQQAKDLQKEAE